MYLLRSSAGFTLLEAVVAVTIVSLVGAAALGAVGAELRATARGQWSLEAAALAEERLAALELAEVHELESLPDPLARGRFPAPFDHYVWEASSERLRDEADLYELTVTVESSDVSQRLVTHVFQPLIEVVVQ
jgi:type II secretory pathway pseudopilin PulG